MIYLLFHSLPIFLIFFRAMEDTIRTILCSNSCSLLFIRTTTRLSLRPVYLQDYVLCFNDTYLGYQM